MTPAAVVVFGFATAVAAAARSTWSPCGLSMLSSVTPLAERGRGQRFGVTASFFVVGSAVGGATLGAGSGAVAAVVGAAHLESVTVGALVTVVALAAGAMDAGHLPPALPHVRRQVDERWLNRFRGWVCGTGYGWQIGVGVATYVMTAAVYLMAVLSALTGDPVLALAVCTCFGAVRGLSVLAVAGARTPARLAAVHRRIERAREPVRRGVIVVELLTAAFSAVAVWGTVGGLVIAAVAGPAVGARLWPRPRRRTVPEAAR